MRDAFHQLHPTSSDAVHVQWSESAAEEMMAIARRKKGFETVYPRRAEQKDLLKDSLWPRAPLATFF